MSRPPLDLTGRRFGRLTAVERLEKKGSNYVWRCTCDCGGEANVEVRSLLSGNTTSCGCLKREASRGKAKDITGQRFGRLKAIRPLEERRNGSVLWLCACDCGKQTSFSYNELVHAGCTSCGCARRESKPPALHYVEGTCIERLQPKRLRSDNTTGHTGVMRAKKGWRAQIYFQGKSYYLGVFDEFEDAVRARERAEREVFGSFLEWYEKEYRGEAPRTKGKAKDKRSPAVSTAGGAAALLYYKG